MKRLCFPCGNPLKRFRGLRNRAINTLVLTRKPTVLSLTTLSGLYRGQEPQKTTLGLASPSKSSNTHYDAINGKDGEKEARSQLRKKKQLNSLQLWHWAKTSEPTFQAPDQISRRHVFYIRDKSRGIKIHMSTISQANLQKSSRTAAFKRLLLLLRGIVGRTQLLYSSA